MAEDEFWNEYHRYWSGFSKDLQSDISNGKFLMDINKVTNIDEFEKLCHYIYYEHRCIAQKIPYSFTVITATRLFCELHYEKHDFDRELLYEMNRRIRKRMNEDIIEYSKVRFQKKFEKANGKSWYQFW